MLNPMNQHYFTENPQSEIKEKSFTEKINGIELNFTSVSGVFSFENRIDKVSQHLIKNFRPTGGTVLDVGCGYGAIGLFIKALYPSQEVTLIDINNRALDYTRKNSLSNSLTAEILRSDLYEVLGDRVFDDIISNPPFAAGKELNIRLIAEAHRHLSSNGALWLAAFHNKGGSTLKDIMKSVFGNAADMDKSGGIRVYKSVKT